MAQTIFIEKVEECCKGYNITTQKDIQSCLKIQVMGLDEILRSIFNSLLNTLILLVSFLYSSLYNISCEMEEKEDEHLSCCLFTPFSSRPYTLITPKHKHVLISYYNSTETSKEVNCSSRNEKENEKNFSSLHNSYTTPQELKVASL